MASSQYLRVAGAQLHLLAQYIPQAKVATLLQQHGVASERAGKLPADFMV